MYRLCIADDEQFERMVLSKTLHNNLGDVCEIYEATNGREALELYEKHNIQIMLLDIEMPGINGIQAAEIIRKTDPNCSIIFLTAFDEFSYAKKAITVRALDYLLKPYSEDELLSVLEEAMRLTDARQTHVLPISSEEPVEHTDVADEESTTTSAAMIRQYLVEHYSEDISMQDVARHMNYSEAYFCKLFKQYFDQNFTSYLTAFRIGEAKKLLTQPNINVKDVGAAVGYNDSNYFTKVFKRATGYNPSEYRNDVQKKAAT